ncbi:MAG TPA: hypothetical protein VFR69_05610 [Rubrobacteraceae bacterium]|nr:hypothetical protein [Rubrobacteraceae bacterium]
MSGEASYDVYVKQGVDYMGRDEFGEAVAHFVERSNAVALKRRLVARGETVRVERSLVHGLSEKEKERWFSDYSRVPEYEPPLDQGVARVSSEAPQGAVVNATSARRPDKSTTEAPNGSEQLPWWRKILEG